MTNTVYQSTCSSSDLSLSLFPQLCLRLRLGLLLRGFPPGRAGLPMEPTLDPTAKPERLPRVHTSHGANRCLVEAKRLPALDRQTHPWHGSRSGFPYPASNLCRPRHVVPPDPPPRKRLLQFGNYWRAASASLCHFE